MHEKMHLILTSPFFPVLLSSHYILSLSYGVPLFHEQLVFLGFAGTDIPNTMYNNTIQIVFKLLSVILLNNLHMAFLFKNQYSYSNIFVVIHVSYIMIILTHSHPEAKLSQQLSSACSGRY